MSRKEILNKLLSSLTEQETSELATALTFKDVITVRAFISACNALATEDEKNACWYWLLPAMH